MMALMIAINSCQKKISPVSLALTVDDLLKITFIANIVTIHRAG